MPRPARIKTCACLRTDGARCAAGPGDSIEPMNARTVDESLRAAKLVEAQGMAAKLFDEISDRGLVRAGIGERALSDEIRDLAAAMFGITRHWHKRIVRSGMNTLETYRDNPPDRRLSEDDVVFLDFGPIFEEWEADF